MKALYLRKQPVPRIFRATFQLIYPYLVAEFMLYGITWRES